MPALYALFLDRWLPERFEVIGIGHGDMREKAFQKHLPKGINDLSRRGKVDEQWTLQPGIPLHLTCDSSARAWTKKRRTPTLPREFQQRITPGKRERTGSGLALWWKSLSAPTWLLPKN